MDCVGLTSFRPLTGIMILNIPGKRTYWKRLNKCFRPLTGIVIFKVLKKNQVCLLVVSLFPSPYGDYDS